MQADSDDVIFQQRGAPPHCHLGVQAYLNENVLQRWIGRRGARDLWCLACSIAGLHSV